MFNHGDALDWPELARPYGQAEHALGRLAQTLETTRLHQAWLWRELTRMAIVIAQIRGYRVRVDHLRTALIGGPIDSGDNTSGLAAAKRIFLAATPLFRRLDETDSYDALWPDFWTDDRPEMRKPIDDISFEEGREGGDDDRTRLKRLVCTLAGLAGNGRRPVLIDLFVALRDHAQARHLSPSLLRLAFPLALAEAGLLPKPAPGLLGGRRLPLGMSTASPAAPALSDWLKTGLEDLAGEAHQSQKRLSDLARQHQAWHGALIDSGLRRHARAPKALDLLTATPALSIGLVAKHLRCSHVAAGKIVERLIELGILVSATGRSRHKIFVAGDLSAASRDEAAPNRPLTSSQPMPLVDVEALNAMLDGLFTDLERLERRAEASMRAG